MSLEIFVYTNKGERIGDVLNASDRRLSLPHMRAPQFTWTLPITHIRVPKLVQDPCIVQVRRVDPRYPERGSKIIYNGHVVSSEENGAGDAQTVAFTSIGPLWMLTKRVIPQSLGAGYLYPPDVADGAVGEHPAVIARDVLDQVNNILAGTQHPGGWYHTGIRQGLFDVPQLPVNSPRRVIYGPVTQKTAAEAISELSAGASTFEWVITPLPLAPGPDFGGGEVSPFPIISRFDVNEVIGTARPNAVFQFGGDGRTNVESYSRTVSRDGLTNHVSMPTQTYDDPLNPLTAVIERHDNPSMDVYNMLDDIVQDSGIRSTTLKTNIVQEHVNVRKSQREIITFKPQINAWPSPISDYDVGDTVRCRAVVGGQVRFDRLMRVWGITLTFDANGNEAAELELTMP